MAEQLEMLGMAIAGQQNQPIRILILEDNRADVELAKHFLEAADLKIQVDEVRSSKKFMQQMESGDYDLILCDFTLPDWNGLAALRWVRDSGFTTPFIYVSGTLGEEIAVQCIKEGATDYVLKTKLDRLPMVVKRVLNEQQTRTDRDQARRGLREAEERLAIAFRAIPEGITISRLEDGRYLEVNDAFVELVGYEREELLGRSAQEMGIWVSPETRLTLIDKLQGSEPVRRFETDFRAKSGRLLSVELSAERLHIQGETCLLAVTRDITLIKSLEQQLQQAQKMEAIGRLAGGVSHDFNNLLMIMGSSADLMMESLQNPELLAKHTSQIRSAVTKAAGLTRQLLAFSRKQVLLPTVLNLNDIVRDLMKMLPRLLGEDVEVDLVLRSELGNVNADRGQIEQIIMNLAVNSRDAMPEGGKLTVETDNVELDASYGEAYKVKLEPGSYVMLGISDTGVGMTAEVQAHLFEPFFTTKDVGKGTGLGLATVYGIVKQSGGFIWPYSKLGVGTSFRIYLPRCDRPLEPARTDVVPGNATGSECVLLVEDEAQLRSVTAEYLRSRGYHVLEAPDSASALRLSNEHSGKIDLLITDMIMPGLSGLKVAEMLYKTRPNLKVIVVSGYLDQAAHQTESTPTSRFLQKPFPLSVLAQTIRSLMDRRDPEAHPS